MVGLLGSGCVPVPFTRTLCWICNHLPCHGRVDLFDLFAQGLLDVGHRALTIHAHCKGAMAGMGIQMANEKTEANPPDLGGQTLL